jgi:hypothetical protein
MKNLIIALFITLSSLSLKAQEEFNGMWENKASNSIKTILASPYSILSCNSTSFSDFNIINEPLIHKSAKSFTTILENKANGYKVEIEYTLINKDSILSKYTGDHTDTYILTKIY